MTFDFDTIIRLFMKYNAMAEKSASIKDPAVWALHQTVAEVDRKRKEGKPNG